MATPSSATGPILVVGYGNRLRRDDAVGPMAAEEVARRGVPGVVAVSSHQLLPELAEQVASARVAIFVDARLADGRAGIRVVPIRPSESPLPIGHMGDPRRLLALAREVFGTSPRAWLVTVPATDLSTGEGLSPAAASGLREALGRIDGLLDAEGLAPSARRHRP
ncbi:hydrogenase maturation protease [Tautonia plasticadhaerens]|uniref:Hydrogenase maturation protease n=1 Tax=Tautonia plasticadhaerens TaxID=2527974 RepID=A0A518H3E6_9BACT|nr:hydrogenase maturation protease [Tautonia plasticadhaerens]QDV35381.1 hypothetical protein ElP_32840 [Tautonia plasticadhaerens]